MIIIHNWGRKGFRKISFWHKKTRLFSLKRELELTLGPLLQPLTSRGMPERLYNQLVYFIPVVAVSFRITQLKVPPKQRSSLGSYLTCKRSFSIIGAPLFQGTGDEGRSIKRVNNRASFCAPASPFREHEILPKCAKSAANQTPRLYWNYSMQHWSLQECTSEWCW